MKTINIFFVWLLLLGCISCSDDDSQPETRSLSKADIRGQVQLWDEGLTPLGNAEMTIRIDGLNISAKTDAEGKFTLPDVPFGTYDLVYEKAGYGTFKMNNIAHSEYYNYGQGTDMDIEMVNLGQVSPTRVTGLSVELVGYDLLLTVTTDPVGSKGNEQYVRFYWADSKARVDDVSTNGNPRISLIVDSNPQTFSIPLKDFLDEQDWWGLDGWSGEELFVKVFGESYYDNRYYDDQLGKSVHPNLQPSSVDAVSFIVP